MKVIYILWQRQLKRFFRSKSRMIGSLGQPLLFLIAFSLGFGPMYAAANGGDYINFLAPGIIAMSILFTSVFSGIEIIWDRQFGFLKETLVAPVPRMKIMIGRTLGGATVAIIQGIIVMLLSMLVGFRFTDWSQIPLALLFMSLIAIVFTAIGTAIASVLDDMHGFQMIMNFLIMPIFFLSGALFPLSNLPPAVLAVVKFNPLSYGVDGLRYALTGAATFAVSTNIAVLVFSSAALFALGSYLFSKIQI